MFRALIALALLAVLPAQAQEWPTKPVRMIVPFPPAAAPTRSRGRWRPSSRRSSAAGRDRQQGRRRRHHRRRHRRKSPADGYTVLLYSVHGAVATAAYKSLPYDLQKDLVPVTTAAIFPDVLVAANRVPAKTLPELIAWAKANPGKLNCGSAGNGTSRHLSCELFNAAAGVNATHVPYKGTGPATQALVAGEIDWIFEALGSAAGQIRAGTDPADRRHLGEALAGVPRDSHRDGVGPRRLRGHLVVRPLGARRHAGAVMQKLHDAVVKAFADPELKDMWAKLGAEPGGSLARGLSRPDRQGRREVGQGRARGEDHARIAVRTRSPTPRPA
jgi:hypothetical protein